MSERISDEQDQTFLAKVASERYDALIDCQRQMFEARATIATLEARIALLEKALADDNEAGHLALAIHERDQARIRELEKALEAQSVCDGKDGILCFCTPEFREGDDDDSEHAAYCQIARAALAKPKEAQNG